MASPSSELDIIYSVIEKEFDMFTEHEKKHLYDPEKLTDDGRTYTFLAPLSDTYDTSMPSEPSTTFAFDILAQSDINANTSHFDVPDQFTTVATLNNPETTDVQGHLTQPNAEVVNVIQGRNGHILAFDHAPPSVEGLMVTHDIVDESVKMDVMVPVSPKEVFGDDAPKKRGRKRKSDGSQTPPSSSSSRRRPKKPKAYEREIPFEDEEQERKRKNAMNAKRHRDQQKKNLQDLRDQLKSVTEERDALKKELDRLRLQEQTAMQQLLVYQQGQTTATTAFPLLVIEQPSQP